MSSDGWGEFTVTELKTIITSNGFKVPSSEFKKKINYIDFCQRNFTQERLFAYAVQFGKASLFEKDKSSGDESTRQSTETQQDESAILSSLPSTSATPENGRTTRQRKRSESRNRVTSRNNRSASINQMIKSSVVSVNVGNREDGKQIVSGINQSCHTTPPVAMESIEMMPKKCYMRLSDDYCLRDSRALIRPNDNVKSPINKLNRGSSKTSTPISKIYNAGGLSDITIVPPRQSGNTEIPVERSLEDSKYKRSRQDSTDDIIEDSIKRLKTENVTPREIDSIAASKAARIEFLKRREMRQSLPADIKFRKTDKSESPQNSRKTISRFSEYYNNVVEQKPSILHNVTPHVQPVPKLETPKHTVGQDKLDGIIATNKEVSRKSRNSLNYVWSLLGLGSGTAPYKDDNIVVKEESETEFVISGEEKYKNRIRKPQRFRDDKKSFHRITVGPSDLVPASTETHDISKSYGSEKRYNRGSLPSGDVSNYFNADLSKQPQAFTTVAHQQSPIDPRGNPIMWRIASAPVEPPAMDTVVKAPLVSGIKIESIDSTAPVKISNKDDVTRFSYMKCLYDTIDYVCKDYLYYAYMSVKKFRLHLLFLICVIIIVKKLKLFEKTYYCDSIDLADNRVLHNENKNCNSCPRNAKCHNGVFECNSKYRSEWYGGIWRCVRDTKSYQMAHKYLHAVVNWLSGLEGERVCGYVDTSTATRDDIENHLRIMVDKTSDYETFKMRISILFDELLPQIVTDETIWAYDGGSRSAFGIRTIRKFERIGLPGSGLVEVYQSMIARSPISCRISNVLWRYAWIIILSGILLSFGSMWNFRRRRRARAMECVYSIIVCETKISQGYAVGPNVRDICRLAHASEEYRDAVKCLDENTVRQLCRELLRGGKGIASGCLSFDVVPFYFSKSAAEELQRMAEDSTVKSVETEITPKTGQPRLRPSMNHGAWGNLDATEIKYI